MKIIQIILVAIAVSSTLAVNLRKQDGLTGTTALDSTVQEGPVVGVDPVTGLPMPMHDETVQDTTVSPTPAPVVVVVPASVVEAPLPDVAPVVVAPLPGVAPVDVAPAPVVAPLPGVAPVVVASAPVVVAPLPGVAPVEVAPAPVVAPLPGVSPVVETPAPVVETPAPVVETPAPVVVAPLPGVAPVVVAPLPGVAPVTGKEALMEKRMKRTKEIQEERKQRGNCQDGSVKPMPPALCPEEHGPAHTVGDVDPVSGLPTPEMEQPQKETTEMGPADTVGDVDPVSGLPVGDVDPVSGLPVGDVDPVKEKGKGLAGKKGKGLAGKKGKPEGKPKGKGKRNFLSYNFE